MSKQPARTTRDSFAQILSATAELDPSELASRMRRASLLFRWPELLETEAPRTTSSLAWVTV